MSATTYFAELDYVVAVDPETDIFGVGSTKAAAAEDLLKAFVQFRECLQDSGPLSPRMQRLLDLLEKKET